MRKGKAVKLAVDLLSILNSTPCTTQHVKSTNWKSVWLGKFIVIIIKLTEQFQRMRLARWWKVILRTLEYRDFNNHSTYTLITNRLLTTACMLAQTPIKFRNRRRQSDNSKWTTLIITFYTTRLSSMLESDFSNFAAWEHIYNPAFGILSLI